MAGPWGSIPTTRWLRCGPLHRLQIGASSSPDRWTILSIRPGNSLSWMRRPTMERTRRLAVVQGRVVEGAPHPRIHHRAPVGSGSPPSSAKRRMRYLADLLTVGGRFREAGW